MRVKRPGRLLAAISAAFVPLFAIALPAWAQSNDPPTVGLNPASAGMTAEEFPTKSCASIPGGRSRNMDGWVFELPTPDAQLEAVVAAFHVGNGEPSDGQYQVAVISKPGFVDPQAVGSGNQFPSGIVTSGGTNKAWVQTPRNDRYELSYGEASLNGETSAKFFTITHTCPAGCASSGASVANGGNVATVVTQDPSEGEEATGEGEGAGGSGSETSDPEEPAAENGEGDPTADPSGSTSPSPAVADTSQNTLPITGAAIGGMIVGGLFMITLGAVLIAVRRRRRSIQFEA